MRYRSLGRDGPPISVVGFGTWAAGGDMWGPVQDAEVVAAMRRAFELGVTWVDTADAYGWGHAEELVARAVAGRRDEVFVATKVGITPRGIDLSPGHLRAACEASLRRLRTDRIDLYQIHWPGGRGARLEDAWETMAGLQDAGKVRFIGVSNFTVSHLERCEPIRHVDSLQPEYSMLVRDPEETGLLDWCRAHGTGVVAYGSLAYGILTGKFTPETRFDPSDWRSGSMGIGYYDRLFAPRVFRRHLEKVDRLRAIARELGITVAQLAVAWLLRDEVVTSAICGAKRPEQIEETAAAGDVTLDEETLVAVEKILSEG
jgi:aryl-alcohol dehydrogenase-like predicted oxidoreductase